MSRTITPVSNSQSFDQWVAATNNLIIVAAATITVAANATGDSTTGNGFVTGILGATTVVAPTLRGGSVSTPGALTISSNVVASGAQANVTANVYISAANTTISTNSTVKAIAVTGNASATAVTLGGDILTVTSNGYFLGRVLQVPVGNTASRPTVANGMFRINTDLGLPEVYYNSQWLTIAATTGNITASSIAFTPTANIVANTVQAAIAETYAEKVTLAGDSMSGVLNINTNGQTLPPVMIGSVLQLGSGDSNTTAITIDSFSNSSGVYGRRADGIAASRTPVLTGETLMTVSAFGYDGNTYFNTADASIEFKSGESFTNTAHGTSMLFSVTPVTTAAKTPVLTLTGSGAAVTGNLSATGTITTNTITFLANSGLVANTTGLFVKANTGIIANSAGTFIDPSVVVQPGTTTTVTVGYTFTSYNIGVVSSGTFTPVPANGNYQYYNANGAHTFAAPSSDCAIDVMITNGSAAGTITFSGYNVSALVGDPLTTTNASKFLVSIRRIGGVSTYVLKALQ